MQHYISYHGLCFTVKTNEQAKRLEAKLKSMTYSEVAKLHGEIYGATLPKNAPVGNGA